MTETTMILDAVIIGAGAAGLTAGYDLVERGVTKIRILEATQQIGGRMRIWETNNANDPLYMERPLNMGAEWVHNSPDNLKRIVNHDVTEFENDLERYKPSYQWWWAQDPEWGAEEYSLVDYNFQSSTWYEFFEQEVAPSTDEALELNCVVTEIDYSDDEIIQVACEDGREFATRACIVTVALPVVQDITWTPALPQGKQDALDQVAYNAGLKVFLAFSKKFYAHIGDAFDLLLDGREAEHEDANYYYDATYESSNDGNAVLGAFINGYFAERFRNEADTNVILNAILADLDAAFDGQASANFVSGRVTNWSQEPFFRGTYSDHGRSNTYHLIGTLAAPMASNRIFFAGEGLMEDFGYVHTAAFSGQIAARSLTGSTENECGGFLCRIC